MIHCPRNHHRHTMKYSTRFSAKRIEAIGLDPAVMP